MTDHLAKAREYIGRGEEFYRKAAAEIIAAMAEDTTLGYGRVAIAIGKSETWCRDIVRWSTNPLNTATPFAGEYSRVKASLTKSSLRDAPAEDIAAMLDDPQVRANVAKAQNIASAKVIKRSYEAQREAIGQSESDQLEQHARFQDAEAELFKARRGLIETLRILNEIGAEDLPDSWREEFLRTLDDLAAKIDLGRSLLAGSLDEEFEKLLGA